MGKKLVDLIDIEEIKTGSDKRLEMVSGKDIAVIGVSAKFPMADSIDGLWYNLINGIDCIRHIPDGRRKDIEDYYCFTGREISESAFEKAGYLDHIHNFDHAFFGLSPKEASLMDPNQRLFLETSWKAVEDAGYGGGKLAGSRTGVYVGFSGENEYKKLIGDVEPEMLSMAVPGNLAPIVASRISYLMDLRGPSMVINTVCSSSLVAVHLACRAIRNGECDLAIAGGSQIYVLPVRDVKIGVESSDNKTKTFDDSSDGTAGGEGVAAVLLKPLSKALKDRDHIYAVIKGSAVNQDGNSIGISAPNPAAQEDVIIRAWKDAGIDPETITYIEAHGTGTKLGDPIEIEGIQRAFGRYTDKKQFCAVGSVKTNIGHLDASSGIAGFIKAALALKNKTIPPSLHFSRPNRKIRFHKSPVYVVNRPQEWRSEGTALRCGVSSFGFSGTNCHIVLEEAPAVYKKGEELMELKMLTLSAKSGESLGRLVEEYIEQQDKVIAEGLDNVCFTANTGRGHYGFRLAMILTTDQDFREKLELIHTQGIKTYQDQGIYFGFDKDRIAGGSREITSLKAGIMSEEANKKINEFIGTKRRDKKVLHEICKLYAEGVDIDWEGFYSGGIRNRASVPTYPFESTRCWLQIPARQYPMYHTVVWKNEDLNLLEKSADEGIVLILEDVNGIGKEIAVRLRNDGRTVIEVESGDEYKKRSSNNYTVSGDEEDFKKLFTDIRGEKIARIVHMFSMTSATVDSVKKLDEKLNNGVLSLFHMYRSLESIGVRVLDVVLLSQYVNEVDKNEKCINPENAAMFGLGKVINIENPEIRCRAIDVDEETDIEQMIMEIYAGYKEYNVAYRRGKRYIQELDCIDAEEYREKEIKLKHDGFYIITGGIGGLGLETAKLLASKGKITIALLSRTKMPGREEWEAILKNGTDKKLCSKIKDILYIEKTGARLVCCSVDVSKEEELRETVARLKSCFGRINGVVHSAGIGAGKEGVSIRNDTEEIFKEVLKPKVQGTWLLKQVIGDDTPDFFVLFSSPITLMGGTGSGSYTSANAYLDSFTAYNNKLGNRTIAMSWAPWEETVKTAGLVMDKNRHMFDTLSTTEITGSFWELLNKNSPIAIVGRINYKSTLFYLEDYLAFRISQKIRSQMERLNAGNETTRENLCILKTADVNLTGREDGSYSTTEKQLANVLGQVLGYNELNINHNFYELGGDSIIAARAVGILNKQMGLNIKIADLLKNPNLREFAQYIELKYLGRIGEGDKCSEIPITGRKDFYKVSSSQRRVYLMNQNDKTGIGWNIPYTLIVEGNFDQKRFKKILGCLIKRHDSLRTSFHEVKGEIVQKIHEDTECPISFREAYEEGMGEIIKEFVKPFDLNKPPLFRAGLVRFNPLRHLLLFDIHHIIADEVSMEVLVGEIASLYEGKDLPELRIQYKDFARWQDELVNREYFKEQEQYWLNVFSGEIPVLELPTDYPRPAAYSPEGERVVFEFEKELSARINRLALETRTTPYWVLMAVFNILLHKYSGQDDIVVGVPVEGRFHPDIQKVIGMFINVLPLRNFPSADKTFMRFLEEVKENLLKAYTHQEYPFDVLVERLKIIKSSNRSPLFDVSFQIHKTVLREIVFENNIKFLPVKMENKTSKQDMLLEAFEVEDRFYFEWVYNTSLFTRESIEQMVKSFIHTAWEVVQNPYIKLRDIRLISGQEKSTLLADFNEEL